MVRELAQRARAKADWKTKPTTLALKEIDPIATKISKKMEKEEQGHIRTMQIGGGHSKEDLA